MTNKLFKMMGTPVLGAAALMLASFAVPAFAADVVNANVPFAFMVGNKTMPAGDYDFRIDVQKDVVTVEPTAKGREIIEPIITYLSTPAHSTATDAHVVFDMVGNNHILSEIWRPDQDGVLVHVTKGPHKHHVLHVKR